MSYEKIPINILECKGKDSEEPINSSCECAMAATLVRRGDVGIRRKHEVSLPLVIQVTRYEFGGPNFFKEGRNCNDRLKGSKFI